MPRSHVRQRGHPHGGYVDVRGSGSARPPVRTSILPRSSVTAPSASTVWTRRERDLAEEYGVAHLTARRATRELRERGLVVTLPAKGTFVAYPEADEPVGSGQEQ
ncbi:GntR family transcriptional regulator [Streptomyces phaeochromogenes]|uniref:GntR family transcriptional regulator n=1 Tax=Streptomyces phaeochromogenes TaxID=1923 RepID=UPI003719A0F4